MLIDEAQSFLSDALVTTLSESRKFGLGMVLSHQFIAQLPPSVQSAVLGNVGTMCAFRVSGDDADVLAKHYGTLFSPSAFIEAQPFTALVRPVDGAGYPFRLLIESPTVESRGFGERIIHRSRQRYCSPRLEVENKLSRWLDMDTI
jgi:DNA helicase HerA-like ATPase